MSAFQSKRDAEVRLSARGNDLEGFRRECGLRRVLERRNQLAKALRRNLETLHSCSRVSVLRRAG